ncbi:MAG: type II toxin-antitoxin system PemK/MazF family toxin [Syntrophobacteraceae bacterium]|jgi:mRNA interferase MazF
MVRRGDVVIAVFSGDYGKPRPAVVVQTDLANPTHSRLVVCPITSHLENAPLFRLEVSPSPDNSLERSCQIMVDKITTVRKDKLRQVIGRLNEDTMIRVNRSLAFWLGLG